MDSKEYAGLTPGTIIVRRHDKSRWEVKKVVIKEREDPGAQQIMGSIITVYVRRISPEYMQSSEPLQWVKE